MTKFVVKSTGVGRPATFSRGYGTYLDEVPKPPKVIGFYILLRWPIWKPPRGRCRR